MSPPFSKNANPTSVAGRLELRSRERTGSAVAVRNLLPGAGLRAKPLIVTIFGDALQPQGDGIWLSSLIRLAGPFGLSERVVRTAVFRLRREGWLRAQRSGRRSFYRLQPTARRQFETAESRIYSVPRDIWDGHWSLVILDPAIAGEDRERLMRELRWAGFAPFASNILAYPAREPDMLGGVIAESGLEDKLLRLTGETLPGTDTDSIRRIIERNWKLDEVRQGYEAFLARFSPVLDRLTAEPRHDGEEAFLLRTLLIDEYRRILLKDPALPLPLLPADWPGQAAAILTRNIYRIIAGGAQEHVRQVLAEDGLETRASARFYERFGGV